MLQEFRAIRSFLECWLALRSRTLGRQRVAERLNAFGRQPFGAGSSQQLLSSLVARLQAALQVPARGRHRRQRRLGRRDASSLRFSPNVASSAVCTSANSANRPPISLSQMSFICLLARCRSRCRHRSAFRKSLTVAAIAKVVPSRAAGFVSAIVRKLPFEHRIRKFRSRSLGHLLRHRLIELALKHFLRHGRHRNRLACRPSTACLEHLAIKRFADELGELVVYLCFARSSSACSEMASAALAFSVAFERCASALRRRTLRQRVRKLQHGGRICVPDCVRRIDHLVSLWLIATR